MSRVARACSLPFVLLCLLLCADLHYPRAHAQSISTQGTRLETPRVAWSEASANGLGPVDRYALSLQLRAGGASAPFFSRAFPSVLGHGLILQLAGAYRLREQTLLSIQLPLVILEIAQPAGSYVNQFSWGNANVTLADRSELWRGARFTLYGLASVSTAAPTAQWGPKTSLLGLRALQVANAMDALRQQELYTSGALPIAASYGVLLEQPQLGLEANLRVPVFIRFSRARLPSDADVRWLAVTPVLHLAVRYSPYPWVDLSLAADTVFNGLAPVQATRAQANTQLALIPAVSFAMRRAWALRADFVSPVAGPLGGHAFASGLQLVFSP